MKQFICLCLALLLVIGSASAAPIIKDQKFTGAPDFSAITNKSTVRTDLGVVGLTGNEIIAGEKTWTGYAEFQDEVHALGGIYADSGNLTLGMLVLDGPSGNLTINTSDSSNNTIFLGTGGAGGEQRILTFGNDLTTGSHAIEFATGNSIIVTLPAVAATKIPVSAQTLTFTGPTAPRTVTLPDEAFTVVGVATTQTLTNKTISGGSASGLTGLTATGHQILTRANSTGDGLIVTDYANTQSPGDGTGVLLRVGGYVDYGSMVIASYAPGTTQFDSPGTAGGAMTVSAAGLETKVGLTVSTVSASGIEMKLILSAVKSSHDVPSIASGTTETTTVTVTGATTTSVATVTHNGTWPAGLPAPYARVTSSDTVTIYAPNPSAGAVDPGSQDFRVLVINF